MQRTADYAKRRRVQQLVVISALSAYWPDATPLALRHYSRMKHESDDYVQRRGVPYVILRPGPLSDEPARGTIALATERGECAGGVAGRRGAHGGRKFEARVEGKVIGFVGGDVAIEDVLDELEALAS